MLIKGTNVKTVAILLTKQKGSKTDSVKVRKSTGVSKFFDGVFKSKLYLKTLSDIVPVWIQVEKIYFFSSRSESNLLKIKFRFDSGSFALQTIGFRVKNNRFLSVCSTP